MTTGHIAIVGAGQAGAALAERLRHKGYQGAITLFGQEAELPYQRPPLSKKYLGGEWGLDRLVLRPESHWQELDIRIATHCSVSRIDAKAQTLVADGKTVAWDRLALTTGAKPRPLPQGLERLSGVYEMRSIADADALRADFIPGRHLLILGGGYIGLETAAVAAEAGLRVTVIEQAPRILARVASEETAQAIRALHDQHGVTIREGCKVSRYLGEGLFSGVRLASGEEIKADLMLVGIGVNPCTELAEAAGIRCNNGIVVDGFCRTSAPNIWAAGDCASFPYEGQPTRLESVPNAIEQAECAADDMLGASRIYEPVPWFWSDQYDLKLQIAGLNRGYDQVLAVASERGSACWYFKQGRMIALDALNEPRLFMAAKKMIEKKLVLTYADAASEGFDAVKWLQAASKSAS